MNNNLLKWAGRSTGLAVLGGLLSQGIAYAQEVVEETVEVAAEVVDTATTAAADAASEAAAAAMAAADGAASAAAEVGSVAAYVDNSYLFLISGMVVMFMAAGFCMLEVGLVRSKNAATQAVKNVMLYSVAGIMVYLVGYHMIYPATDWAITFSDSKAIAAAQAALEKAQEAGVPKEEWPEVPATMGFLAVPDWLWSPGDREALDSNGYAPASDWYFQMVFVATAASIVSGTLAERIKILPFMIFTAILTGFIYPIQASWQWGGGWLADIGFSDFAGSTLVHSTGGWAALVGALFLGARTGKYEGGKVHPMPGSNIPLAALGTFILWLGWFGFNGGSQLAAGTAADINAVSIIFANTNLAAAGGVVAAAIMTTIMFKKMDPTMVFNGAIAGLVAITAEPLTPELWEAILIGAVGGVLVVVSVPVLDKLKIDDVVGAIPAHLVVGIFGTLVVALNTQVAKVFTVEDAEALAAKAGTTLVDAYENLGWVLNDDGRVEVPRTILEQFIVQLTGVVSIGVFVLIFSAIVWAILKFTMGIRCSEEEEMEGIDKAELGLEAYPEFVK